jgi:hypothetical protein
MNHEFNSSLTPTGRIDGLVVRDLGELKPPSLFWRVKQAWKAKRELPMHAAQRVLGRVGGVIQLKSHLTGQVYRTDWSRLAPWQVLRVQEILRLGDGYVQQLPAMFGGSVIDYGVLSHRVITDVGVAFLVDAFQNTTELETMKYHGLGTGTNAEAVGNTSLQTEITSTHYTGSVRPTGTTEEGASANIYKTVGTHTQLTAGDTIAEHGVFSSATPGAGVLLDRSQFTGVALSVNDSFVTTYQLTFTSGG